MYLEILHKGFGSLPVIVAVEIDIFIQKRLHQSLEAFVYFAEREQGFLAESKDWVLVPEKWVCAFLERF